MNGRTLSPCLMASSCALLLVWAVFAPEDDARAGVGHASAAHAIHVTAMNYTVPEIKLVRDDGKEVSLPAELNDGRAVVLNFIFTTCGSICPLSSQTFGEFQRRLGPETTKVHLVSISTDPEEDTPARLREYAGKFRAGPGWQHYTGTVDASITAQRAFDAYLGDKMSHAPVTWIRAPKATTWRRIDGFVTPDQLLRQYRQLLAQK